MNTTFESVKDRLSAEPQNWVITGVAGFIGSNLLQYLLGLNQRVIGLDNFSTGYQHNLDDVRRSVTSEQWSRFKFIRGDIRNSEDCRIACEGATYVLHQAALGSVPRSISDPAETNASNISGFVNILLAARDAKVKRFVYASSSAVYGDHPQLPKVEETTGTPLSPYAITKAANELYAEVFQSLYGVKTVGLRYFNVFGPRQDPNGAYAAVIPRWIAGMLNEAAITIYGDGETSRDFCYIRNVIQANILAACADLDSQTGQVFNIAYSQRTTLNELFQLIYESLNTRKHIRQPALEYADFRSGDIKHSIACIDKAKCLLGYTPTYSIHDGLAETVNWYVDREAQALQVG